MRTLLRKVVNLYLALLLTTILTYSGRLNGQSISFGIHAEPVISWFSTNTIKSQNNGARAGFNFGFTFNKYFSANYAFSTGLSILNAGGSLTSTDTTKFSNLSSKILPGKPMIYKIQYLNLPIGLQFKSNQIGYITFFSNIGVDPKLVIGGKADIPSLSVKGQDAMDELGRFNLGYHILTGIEYSLGGSTAIVFGIGYENNFFDITKEINNQPIDKVTQNIIRFRFGINF